MPATQIPAKPTLSSSIYQSGASNRVRLICNDPNDRTVSGYEIQYRKTNSGAWTTIVPDTGNVLNYDFETVPKHRTNETVSIEDALVFNAFQDDGGQTHTNTRQFQIRAINAQGKSPWSNTVQPYQ